MSRNSSYAFVAVAVVALALVFVTRACADVPAETSAEMAADREAQP